MKSFFLELFDYSHHYNQLLSQIFLKNLESSTEKSRLLFSHLLSAHHTWNSRIQGINSEYGIWERFPANKFKDIDQKNYGTSLQVLEHYGLEQVIQYKNSRGENFSNNIRDILFHLINHSTYHRGQIASDFRKNGIEPIATDYIFFKRQS